MTSDILSEWHLQYLSFSPTPFKSVSYTVHRHDTLPLVTSPIKHTQRKKERGGWGKKEEGEMAANAHTAESWVGYTRSWEKPSRNSGADPAPKNVPSLPGPPPWMEREPPEAQEAERNQAQDLLSTRYCLCRVPGQTLGETQWRLSSYGHWAREDHILTKGGDAGEAYTNLCS